MAGTKKTGDARLQRWDGGQTSIMLDRDERRLADLLAKRRGLSRAAVIRLLIRERAQAEGLI